MTASWRWRTAVVTVFLSLLGQVQVAWARSPLGDAMLLTLLDLSADEAPSRELAFEVTRALRQHPNVKFRELDETLNLGGEEAAVTSLKSAEGLTKAGVAKLRAGKHNAAVEDLESAVDNYLTALALVQSDLAPLAQALVWLGSAQWQAGDTKAAEQSLARAVQVNPKLTLTTDTLPAKARARWDQVRADVVARPKVDFEVRTEPPHARVYVAGRFMGLSPVYASGLSGEQLVVVSKHGWARRGRIVTVDASHAGLDETLEPARRAAAWTALQGRLADLFDGAIEPSDLTETEGMAGVPYAVAVRATGSRAKMKVEVALCNLSGRQVVQRLSRELKWEGRNKAARDAVDQLVADLLRAPEVAVAPATPAVQTRPVYQTWWFWTIVGAAAVGSGVAVYLATRPSDSPPAYAPGTGGLLILF